MKERLVWKSLICATALLFLAAGSSPAEKTEPAPSRRFEFTYVATIPAPAPGAQTVRLWIPLPQSSKYQDISNLRIVSPVPYSVEKKAEYGNEMLYVDIPAAKAAAGGEVRMTVDVTRREHRVALSSAPATEPPAAQDSAELQRFLQPDRLVPINGIIAQLSAKTTQGISDPLAKARAIYDYVIANMRYDKSGTGWETAMPCGPATPSTATALIFIRSSSAWPAPPGFPRASRLGFRCRRTRTMARSPAITAGLNSTCSPTDGFPSMRPKRGSIPTKRITFSARMTPIASSSRWAATLF